MLSLEEKRKRTHYEGVQIRDLFLIPNLLSLSRVFLTIPALYFIIQHPTPNSDLVAAAFLAAGFLTDVLDGWWARTFCKISDLGKIMDPIIDKFVIISTGLALVLTVHTPQLPQWLIFAVILRDLLIVLFTSKALKEDHYLFTSSWTGKSATFFLAVTFLAYLLSDYLPEHILVILPYICLGLLMLSGVDYLEKYWSVRHKKHLK